MDDQRLLEERLGQLEEEVGFLKRLRGPNEPTSISPAEREKPE